VDHDDSAGAFAAVQGIRAGRFDRFLMSIAGEVRIREALIDPSKPPKRTLDMTESAQVWAWINNEQGGQWEIRGTGAVVER
jgi:hypothetical protein